MIALHTPAGKVAMSVALILAAGAGIFFTMCAAEGPSCGSGFTGFGILAIAAAVGPIAAGIIAIWFFRIPAILFFTGLVLSIFVLFLVVAIGAGVSDDA